jgi:predicted nucleic acid-binding protein
MEKALNIEPKASNTEKILAVKDLLVTDSKINDAVKLAKENPPLSKDEMKKAVMGAATDLFESRRLYDAAYLVGFFRKNGTLTNDDMVSFEQKVMP